MIANQLWFKVKAYLGHKHLFEKGFFLPSRPFLGKYYFTWVFLPSVLCAAVGKHPSSRVPKILPQIIISSSIGDEEWALICRHTHVLTHAITSLLLARSGAVQGKQPRIHHLTFLFCSIELITVTLLTVDVRSDEMVVCSQNSARHIVGTGLSISCHHHHLTNSKWRPQMGALDLAEVWCVVRLVKVCYMPKDLYYWKNDSVLRVSLLVCNLLFHHFPHLPS